jgi:dTDP-4-dehydrorhamnose reductase
LANNINTRVLVLGASGMLGHVVLRLLATSPGFAVLGSLRGSSVPHALEGSLSRHLLTGIDAQKADDLARVFAQSRPHVVVNCVGLVKQLAESEDALAAISMNALLPHRLSRLCEVAGARLVHVSTDCVFSGRQGLYSELDAPDASDLYGRSKLLGEVHAAHAITLRTSIIGPELGRPHGLVGWFLGATGTVKGFTRAVFSGLPTVELARIIRDVVIPRPELHGMHHVSAAPIAKYDLLHLVAGIYGKSIEITADDSLKIDRSLDSTRFRALTGYQPPTWPELVRAMQSFG